MAKKAVGKSKTKAKPAAKKHGAFKSLPPKPPRKKPKAFSIKPRVPVPPPGARHESKATEKSKQTVHAKGPGKTAIATALKGLKGAARAAAEAALLAKKSGRSVAEVASTIPADAKGYVFINGRRVRMISTKGHVAVRRARQDAAAKIAAAAEAETPPTQVKTKLGKKDLNHYKELLLAKRRELVGDLSAMETEALRSSDGGTSHMPIHMADLGTDTHDQDLLLGLAEKEHLQLREIEEALGRIQVNTFGVCQATGKPIPKARLDAKPWAKYSIEAARKMENQWSD